MEVEVTLPQVEGVTHIRCRILKRKPQCVQIHELSIDRQPIRRNHGHAAPDAGKLIQTILARDVPQRRLLLRAPAQFHVQRQPRIFNTAKGLDNTFLQRIQRLLRQHGGGKRKEPNHCQNPRRS